MDVKTEIRPGYKKTKLGWIPKGWQDLSMGDSITFSGGSQPPKETFIFEEREGYIRLIQTRDYRTNNFKTYIRTTDARKLCGLNDIMIGRYGPPIFQLFRGIVGAYNVALIKAIPKTENILKEYAWHFLNKNDLRHYLESLSQRSGGQTGIEMGRLKKYPFPLPPLPEQKKIADILSTWDKAIETTQALIKKLQFRKKGLMQQLLDGKKRLPGFSGEWEYLPLPKILDNAGKRVETEPTEIYHQIGVRSHTKGIFYKEGVTGEVLGNKRVFWIEPDCFIVNIVFAWEHAIAKTTAQEIGMIASHRFPMYKPKKDVLDLDFLLYYFKTPRGKYLLQLASPGGAGRNKTLGKSEFLRLQIPVPALKEQTAIAQVLTKADDEINQTKKYLHQLEVQKKGLMQQLLTGEKRVVV